MAIQSAMVRLAVKAIRVGNSVRVAIPIEILKASGVEEGDTLMVDFDEKENRIVFLKQELAKQKPA